MTMNFGRRTQLNGFGWVLLIGLASACQQSPIPSTSTVEKPKETQPYELKLPAAPVEVAKAPATKSETESKPVLPKISRTLPESIVQAPDKDPATHRLVYNTVIATRFTETPKGRGWNFRKTTAGQVVGFEFSNPGGNRILPPLRDAGKNQFFTRDFQFRFDDRARQDINLLITDWVPSRDRQFRLSELMNSLVVFFPRRFLPAIVAHNGHNIVTLPTGEEVEFDAQSHQILGGALSEAPVDLNPDRSARKFPTFFYSGKGIAVRADARGADPRIGTNATISLGTGAPCHSGTACRQCQVPARELWDQNGALRFKFPTDEEFDRFLLARCQFGLPKFESNFAVSAPNNSHPVK